MIVLGYQGRNYVPVLAHQHSPLVVFGFPVRVPQLHSGLVLRCNELTEEVDLHLTTSLGTTETVDVGTREVKPEPRPPPINREGGFPLGFGEGMNNVNAPG